MMLGWGYVIRILMEALACTRLCSAAICFPIRELDTKNSSPHPRQARNQKLQSS